MLPVLFKIGPFTLHSWGLMLFLAFAAAVLRGMRRANRYGIRVEAFQDAALIGLIGGIVGGRVGFVVQNLGHYLKAPAEIPAIWTGGMTSFGGLIGGVGAGLLAARRKGLDLRDTADLSAVSIAIGYTIGRIGCFLNGCCHGSRCSLPWAVDFHPDGGPATGPVHPAQLYSAAAGLAIYFVLLRVEKHRRFPGQVILTFAILYGIYRFLVEFVREGATAEVLAAGLTTGQIASIAVSVAGAALWAGARRRAAATP